MKKIGVVGSGQMGNGIAQAFITRGYETTMVDSSTTALEKASIPLRNLFRNLSIRAKSKKRSVLQP